MSERDNSGEPTPAARLRPLDPDRIVRWTEEHRAPTGLWPGAASQVNSALSADQNRPQNPLPHPPLQWQKVSGYKTGGCDEYCQ